MSPAGLLRRLLTFTFGWCMAGAVYLVLIDTVSLPELLVGAGAATLAAVGFVLAAEQHLLDAEFRPGWLAKAWRPVLKVPSDIVSVTWVALTQLVRPEQTRGQFKRTPFRCGERQSIETGRQALAESLGSFAPNTIVVGVDEEREEVLVHQLRPSTERASVDMLELG